MTTCPANLALCGVPCGCEGKNPSHRPLQVEEEFKDRWRQIREEVAQELEALRSSWHSQTWNDALTDAAWEVRNKATS